MAGTYHGGSTIIDKRQMGRSHEPWMFVTQRLVGDGGFTDISEFQRYCTLMGRMRAFADNYEQAKKNPKVLDRVQQIIIDTMLEASRLERGKSQTLIEAIKHSQGWPEDFIASFQQAPAPAPAP